MPEDAIPALGHSNGAIGATLKARFDEVIDRAMRHSVAHVAGSAERRVEAVRRMRKTTKILRSTLPLLKEAVPEESLEGAHQLLADTSALLSPIRDRDAMLGTIERLLGHRGEARAVQVKVTLASVVAPDGSEGPSREFEDMLVLRAAGNLSRLATAARRFQFDRISGEFVCDAVEDARDGARRAAQSNWIDAPVEESHAVRKGCARLSLQLGLFEDYLPKSLRRMRASLREVTQSLGNEHDLAMLAQKLSLERARLPSEGFVGTALELCRRARARLREGAAAAAEQAFAVSRRTFHEKLSSSLEGGDES
jgi:CHAD domain-containing protein